MQWHERGDVLEIDYINGLKKAAIQGSNWTTGCFGVLISGVFGFLTFAHLYELGFQDIEVLLFKVFCTLVGSITLLSKSLSGPTNLQMQVLLDREAERLSYIRRLPHRDEIIERYQIGLRDFAQLHFARIRSQWDATNGVRPGYEYHIFLVRTDGSHFWLDGGGKQQLEDLQKKLDQVADFLGLPVTSNIPDGPAREGAKAYSQPVKEIVDKSPTSTVSFAPTPEGFSITLVPPQSLRYSLLKGLVALLFGLTPLALIGVILSHLVGSSFSWPFALLVVMVSLPVLLGVILMINILLRRVEVLVKDDTLECRLRSPFLRVVFQRTVDLPLDTIQAVQLHRVGNDQFWLALQLKSSFALSGTDAFLFGMSSLDRSGIYTSTEGEEDLGLWEISSSSERKGGSSIGDLVAIKTRLTAILEHGENETNKATTST